MIDYTEEYQASYSKSEQNLMAVHGDGDAVLILRRLPELFQRLDGELARYQIEYRDLAVKCEHDRDEAWCRVNSTEFTYWKYGEIKKALHGYKSFKEGENLFNHFNLF